MGVVLCLRRFESKKDFGSNKERLKEKNKLLISSLEYMNRINQSGEIRTRRNDQSDSKKLSHRAIMSCQSFVVASAKDT